MLKAVIFSKNRAMQLDALLSSLNQYCDIFDEVCVIYKTDHQRSYDVLIREYPDVRWVRELVFFGDLMQQIEDYTCLLVDDDIFFRHVYAEDVRELMATSDIVSLRLGPNVRKDIHFEVLSSVDGNIFPRKVLERIKGETIKNPNDLERKLAKHCTSLSMGWYRQSLVGIPNNRVSEGSGCDHMDGDVDILTDMFMDGWRIDRDAIDFECDNVHLKTKYKFKR